MHLEYINAFQVYIQLRSCISSSVVETLILEEAEHPNFLYLVRVLMACGLFPSGRFCPKDTLKTFQLPKSVKALLFLFEEVAEGYCDGVTAGGGWLVVQRRQDGSVDFHRGWVDYEDGFGSLTGEFWYGFRPLHCLTNQGQWEMRIDFTLTDGNKSYLSYSSFKVGLASSNY